MLIIYVVTYKIIMKLNLFISTSLTAKHNGRKETVEKTERLGAIQAALHKNQCHDNYLPPSQQL